MNSKININLLHGDCIELMKDIPDSSVDCIITDPPYKISRETNFHTLKGGSKVGMNFGEWDKDFDLIGWINHVPRVLKDNSNVVIFNAWGNLGDIKRACEENNITVKRCLILRKSNPAPFNRDRLFVNDTEFALWGVYNSKNKPTKWTFNRQYNYEKTIIDVTVQKSTYHPTMKDIRAMNYLVKVLSNENDIVLDPFMGSGQTGIACKNLGRNFIGIEIDDKYFEIAKERICKEKVAEYEQQTKRQ